MSKKTQRINKLLVANRGEIAIRIMRAAAELHIPTIAIFTYEDRYSLHRYKADQAFQIGKDDDPLKPYITVEMIIEIAKRQGANAIHPGYGFLSENVDFARRCREEGIIFIGPDPEIMDQLGDKVMAKELAIKAKVPIIKDSDGDVKDVKAALAAAKDITYPVMIKAAAGGGGRGMRVVWEEQALEKNYLDAKNEALKAFGDGTIFIEKYIDSPKHIEIQLLGDHHGNLVHLLERDCSVQRRFQKVVEVAPAVTLDQKTKDKLYQYAIQIGKTVNYNNAGTVEFLVDANNNIFFIEVNPRVQVEHTITEEITGVDIVRSQILIADGKSLKDPEINIQSQENIKADSVAIQCRITSEDPENGFLPDYGRIIAYRSAGGYGIRLDAGSSYAGAKISPFFDSLLVKVSAKGRTLDDAGQRLLRALKEFRIRGVKTNIGFLENVLQHPTFQSGQCTVKFIDDHKELFKITPKRDSGTKLLRYLSSVIVNGNNDVKKVDPDAHFPVPQVPSFDEFSKYPKGTRDILLEKGPQGIVDYVKNTKEILFTDTTFRDAHQSLLATRMRTIDMLHIAEPFAKAHPEIFSMEMWGGATFDVSMRFLSEDPWHRLKVLREKIPNIMFQMLFRGSNGVGYKAYPDNLIERFIEKAAENGMDIFRIFDSLNWLEAMKVSIKAVLERTNAIAEATMCYTGNLLDKNQHKYNLQYYLDLSKRLEDTGAHMLAVKDMAGLLKPQAAEILIGELKNHIHIPIHLHTHDTSSIQSTTYLKAIDAGVDIVDVALSGVSGLTSQPNFNSVAAYMDGHERNPNIDLQSLNQFGNYWEDVRKMYYPFESGLKAGNAQVYEHEIPGGQYSNLRPQAISLGLEHKFEQIKKNYATVNKMFGDIVKVTPSSKVVGDMALFMASNDLTQKDIMNTDNNLAFPESVIKFFKGDLGQPEGGFPKDLQSIILKDEQPINGRPNQYLEPVDFDKGFKDFQKKFDASLTELDYLSYQLYPKVFEDYYQRKQVYGEVMHLPSYAFFYAIKPNQELLVEIAEGKRIIIKFQYVSNPDEEGQRVVSFELNGQYRQIRVKDASLNLKKTSNKKAEEEHEIGAPLQGKLAKIMVKPGDEVKENMALFVIEAMKMETTITASRSGKVKAIALSEGEMVKQDDLVVELEH